MTPTTQNRHPWRAVIRTVFAAVVAAATLLPVAAAAGGIDTVPAVAQVVAIAGAVTRFLALPVVEEWMRDFVPWLAAAPADPEPGEPFPY